MLGPPKILLLKSPSLLHVCNWDKLDRDGDMYETEHTKLCTAELKTGSVGLTTANYTELSLMFLPY